MTSTFDQFTVFMEKYNFDIITLSETWLNPNVLEYVKMLGYNIYFKNRNSRGGGVRVYVKENLKCKTRKDIMKIDTEFEHLWLEIEGKQKNSKLLICPLYQPKFTDEEKLSWIDRLNLILEAGLQNWNGNVVITGDTNINLINSSHVKNIYMDTLQSYDLLQHVEKPTRKGKSLIDHIITHSSCKVSTCHVLPTPEISDHDAIYVCINTRISRYEPRFKIIRDLKNFLLDSYIQDTFILPFNLVYATDSADDGLDTFNTLINSCIEKHTPLKRIKVTWPPAPRIRDLQISDLQRQCKKHRYRAHQSQTILDWNNFREIRNKLKQTIKHTKKKTNSPNTSSEKRQNCSTAYS